MPEITLHTTGYGPPAVERLHARIAAAKADDPLRPVTIVVPSNSVGVSTRRLLAGGGLGPVAARGTGVAGLTLVTPYRLAELLGAPRLAAAGRRPISTPLLAAAVRTVLAEAPGVFVEVATHPSTEESLVRAYRELSELSPQHLGALAGTGRRAAEVVRVHRAVRERLAPRWYEEADLMAAATAVVAEGSGVLGDLGTVLVHLPQRLSPAAAGLLRRLAERTAVEVVAARTGAPPADADVEQGLERLGLSAPPAAPSTPPITAVVSVSDAEEEVRTAVEDVIAAARGGTPLERMAVLYPEERPYARLAAEHLDAAGIPWNGRGVRPLSDRLLGRWLLDLLAVPDERYSRPAVLGLLGGAPVRTAGGTQVPTGAWERVSREAGVVRDRAEWRAKLTAYAEDRRRRADAESGAEEPREWLVSRHRRDAASAEALRRFAGELFDRLGAVGGTSSWAALVGWCRTMVRRYLGTEEDRASWPEPERVAAERVEEILDRLAALDEMEERTTLGVFRRTLALELAEDLGREGELGRGVLVGTPSAALGVDLDVVVVLGLAEGVYPSRPREDSLLPDADREVVADVLPPRSARTGVQHRHLLAALASARTRRVLVHPRGDLRRNVERTPSRWLLDAVADLPGGTGARELPAGAPWCTTVPSFAARVQTTAFPSTRQEYGLRALAATRPGNAVLAAPIVAGDAVLRAGIAHAAARGRAAFTRYDGNLGALAAGMPSPTDPTRVTSASRLEAWLTCPHAYLLEHVLGVEPVENPEELLEMDAAEKGTLVHDVLERWLLEQLAAGAPEPGDPWPPAARRRLHELAEAACAEAEARGITGRSLLWRRDRRRLLVDLDRFIDADDARRAAEGLTPVGAELAFGLPGASSAPVAIDLGDGRSMRIRGRIDRLDRQRDGTLVVVDYKTGSTSRYRGLREAVPLGEEGTKLQLAVYGMAMAGAPEAPAGVRAEYWFCTTRGGYERIGYRLTDEVAEALRRALRVAADGIGRGHFPLKPPEPGWSAWTACRFCDPDDLGTADRYRDWERVRTAPSLAGYVAYLGFDGLDDEGASA